MDDFWQFSGFPRVFLWFPEFPGRLLVTSVSLPLSACELLLVVPFEEERATGGAGLRGFSSSDKSYLTI